MSALPLSSLPALESPIIGAQVSENFIIEQAFEIFKLEENENQANLLVLLNVTWKARPQQKVSYPRLCQYFQTTNVLTQQAFQSNELEYGKIYNGNPKDVVYA